MVISRDDTTQERDDQSSFSYPAADRFAGVGGSIVGVALFTIALAAVCHEGGATTISSFDQSVGLVILMGAPLFFCLLAVGLYLRTTPIEFNEIGIFRRTVFGTWRQIRWADVKRICIMQATPLASAGDKPITQYFIEAASGFHFPYAPNGPIFFTSKILEHEALLKILNSYVDRFGIPVIDKRPGANGARLQRVE